MVWLQDSVFEVYQSPLAIQGWLIQSVTVVLDCHPVFTTMVILVGWAVKTAVAEVLKDWVGADPQIGEVWLAYSIP